MADNESQYICTEWSSYWSDDCALAPTLVGPSEYVALRMDRVLR
jgi:hypothetical protein